MQVWSVASTQGMEAAVPLDVNEVHRVHAGFVWATLQRLGAHPRDLDDVYQETLIVVHRRARDYDPTAPLRPWLYGICVRVVAGWRRRAHRRYEDLHDTVPEPHTHAQTPEDHAAQERSREILRAVLDEMDLERRAVFVMFEIDELSCDAIAEIIGAPVGTVYSRLHAARAEFQRLAARWQRRHPEALR
jgi:RNA polymerase sigma-70 factor (ECF subfamily)